MCIVCGYGSFKGNLHCTVPQSKFMGGEKGNTTALHQSLSKYLTAQDTLGTPTLIKYNRTLVRLGNLLSLQPQSTRLSPACQCSHLKRKIFNKSFKICNRMFNFIKYDNL